MLHSLMLLTHCLAAVTVPTKFYTCVQGKCALGGDATTDMELDECTIMCEARLWPIPSKVDLGTEGASLNGAVSWDMHGVPPVTMQVMVQMQHAFEELAFNRNHVDAGVTLKVIVMVSGTETVLSMDTHENYTLTGSVAAGITITADTIFGARNGLTTLSQLITYSRVKDVYRMPQAPSITDAPKYPYRGLMIDVSRNFIQLDTLRMTIRAMGMSKLNTLHLHLSDTASFPVEIAGRLNLTETGAYSNYEVYRIQDIAQLVEYATVYGVRLIPEIDQPAHARAGWEWGPEAGLGNLVVCNGANVDWTNSALEPPSGQFDITNDNVLTVLGEIYADLATSFGSTVFHIGGDEVIVGSDGTGTSCWNNTEKAKSVVDWVVAHGYDRSDKETWYGLWRNFTMKSTSVLEKAYAGENAKLEKIMQWAGADASGWNLVAQPGRTTTFPVDLFMFQTWDSYGNSITPTLLNEGYDVVVSNYDLLYLDCGGSSWVQEGNSWCSYNSWYRIYDSATTALSAWNTKLQPGAVNNLKGFEAAMWTEHYDTLSIMTGVWPRAAALAERLWSDPDSNWKAADPRMQTHRDRLAQKGIITAALQPQWCIQNGAYSCTA
eukprot:TRINITY_DN382_c0_g1_i1.p1 TRINITY_DN382_c0_g1~~TRINITY_DN382_c0_g1_i1.p1  ORF type:complete len:605 (+),score=248.79 TRINITY_DN382_c0_g1_i1:72-1886(+)